MSGDLALYSDSGVVSAITYLGDVLIWDSHMTAYFLRFALLKTIKATMPPRINTKLITAGAGLTESSVWEVGIGAVVMGVSGAGKGIRTGMTRKEVKDWVLILAVVLVADITEHREVVQFW